MFRLPAHDLQHQCPDDTFASMMLGHGHHRNVTFGIPPVGARTKPIERVVRRQARGPLDLLSLGGKSRNSGGRLGAGFLAPNDQVERHAARTIANGKPLVGASARPPG